MTELEALKYAIGVMSVLLISIIVGSLYIGRKFEKQVHIVARMDKHSKVQKVQGLVLIRMVDALNRISRSVGVEGVDLEGIDLNEALGS